MNRIEELVLYGSKILFRSDEGIYFGDEIKENGMRGISENRNAYRN
jgi:hypothetical protein